LGALLGLIMARLAQRKAKRAIQPTYALWIGGLGGSLWGAACAAQWLMMSWWDRSWFETSISLGLMAVGTAVTILNLSQLVLAFEINAINPTETLQQPASQRLMQLAQAARQGVLFCAASAALVLLLDPRYRPFPWWWFLAPTISWLALLCCAAQACHRASHATGFLAWALGLSTIGLMLQEGWQNTQALSYGALLLTLAGVALTSSWAKTKPARSAAGALISVE
jgi:hypothetical protein